MFGIVLKISPECRYPEINPFSFIWQSNWIARECSSCQAWSCFGLDVQYSTVQYSTVQYSTVQYSTVQYSTVQYSTVQYSMNSLEACSKFAWWMPFDYPLLVEMNFQSIPSYTYSTGTNLHHHSRFMGGGKFGSL